MPIDGLLTKWNDDRGFGFITPTVGGQEIFIHISAFPKDGRRPMVGELLSFEIEIDVKGKKRAKLVSRPARAGAYRNYQDSSSRPLGIRGTLKVVVSLVVLVAVGALGYGEFSRTRSVRAVASDPQPKRVQTPFTTSAPAASFRCDGRRFCSQMTSCAEATYFLQNCPGTQMDGNGDGVPCEQQWCR